MERVFAEVVKVGILREGGKREFEVVYVLPKTRAQSSEEYEMMLGRIN